MKVVKKTQYFLGEQQVVCITKVFARELGVSETVLRSWADEPQFPKAIYAEITPRRGAVEGSVVKYYPYDSAMAYLAEKIAKYRVNRAKGIGRPTRQK